MAEVILSHTGPGAELLESQAGVGLLSHEAGGLLQLRRDIGVLADARGSMFQDLHQNAVQMSCKLRLRAVRAGEGKGFQKILPKFRHMSQAGKRAALLETFDQVLRTCAPEMKPQEMEDVLRIGIIHMGIHQIQNTHIALVKRV